MSKYVVTLGGFNHEGLKTNVEAIGLSLLNLNLSNVLPKTWLKRAKVLEELNESQNIAATIIYLHTTLLLEASKENYSSAFSEILKQATKSKTIVFIFQDNLDSIFSIRHFKTREPLSLQELKTELETIESTNIDDWDYGKMRLEHAIDRLEDFENRKQEVESFINSIYESGAEVAPFYIRSDVTIRIQEFLNDLEQGAFLKLFVPKDRFQADQLNTLLNVLERYLRQVEGEQFSIDARKSDKGIVYIFRSESGISNIQSLNDAFLRFDSFMLLCGDNPKQASEILKNQGKENSEIIIEQFNRDYRRIILDTKHEFETKTLMLKHRFESEMLNIGEHPSISWSNDSISSLISSAATGGTVIVNTGNLSISNQNKIHNEVDKIINGSINYNENDKQLFELFSKYAEKLEALQCRSDLDQLKDQTVAETARKNAKQRIVGFLLKASKKAGGVIEKVAIEALNQYLNSLLKGTG